MAIEEPKYTVLRTTDLYEIRDYADRVAVETIQGDGENGAFQRLFKYISGANVQSSKIAMTVPVTQSTKIAMTAPVTQSTGKDGTAMRFFLPASYTMDTAPVPSDDRVNLCLCGVAFTQCIVIRVVRRSKISMTPPKRFLTRFGAMG